MERRMRRDRHSRTGRKQSTHTGRQPSVCCRFAKKYISHTFLNIIMRSMSQYHSLSSRYSPLDLQHGFSRSIEYINCRSFRSKPGKKWLVRSKALLGNSNNNAAISSKRITQFLLFDLRQIFTQLKTRKWNILLYFAVKRFCFPAITDIQYSYLFQVGMQRQYASFIIQHCNCSQI